MTTEQYTAKKVVTTVVEQPVHVGDTITTMAGNIYRIVEAVSPGNRSELGLMIESGKVFLQGSGAAKFIAGMGIKTVEPGTQRGAFVCQATPTTETTEQPVLVVPGMKLKYANDDHAAKPEIFTVVTSVFGFGEPHSGEWMMVSDEQHEVFLLSKHPTSGMLVVDEQEAK